MKQFNWSRALLALVIALPLVLGIDYAYDKLIGRYEPGKILAADNLFFKALAALVIAYFVGSAGKPSTKA